MKEWEIVLIGIALSMDAFAVSVTDGIVYREGKKTVGNEKGQCLVIKGRENVAAKCYALIIALTFGIFQALMPMAGYFLTYMCGKWGERVYRVLHDSDHWIAFTMLTLLGGKMIVEGIKDVKRVQNTSIECGQIKAAALTPWMLFVQATATSIDALAVGIGFKALGAGIVKAAVIIGVTTAIICFPAVYLGKKIKAGWGEKAEIAGGLVLTAIGARILLTHLAGKG